MIRPRSPPISANWRSLAGARCCPPIAAANGKRIGVDLNITAREFGASSALDGESGRRRSARGSHVDRGLSGTLAGRGRGLVDHPPPLRVARRAAARATTSSTCRSAAVRCSAACSFSPRPNAMSRCDPRWAAPVGCRRAAVHGTLAGELGHRRFQRPRSADPLAGGPRRGFHRIESAACAGAGGSPALEPVQRIEPAFSQYLVHRGSRGARVSRPARRRASRRCDPGICGSSARAAYGDACRLPRRCGCQVRDSRAAVS